MAIYIPRAQYLGHFGPIFCHFLGPNGPIVYASHLKLWFVVTTHVHKYVYKI